MFINHKGWGRVPAFLTVSTLVLFLRAVPSVAEYRDPIDLPALKKESVQQSLLLDVAQVGNRLVAVGERGHILYTDRQETNWKQADVASRAHLNAVTFVDDSLGWAVGEDQVILHTEDGGESWRRQYVNRDADLKGPLLDLYFRNPREGFAIGVFNLLLHTVDGGRSWQSWQEHIDNLDEWHLFAIAAASPDRLYIASEKGLVFRSLNGGEHFEAIDTGHLGTFHGILARSGENSGDRLVLFGVGGVLYTSIDGGKHWRAINTGVETGLAGGSWLPDGSALIVGTDGVVLRLERTLDRVRQGAIENGLPLSNVVHSANGQLTLVGLGGIQSHSLDKLLR